MGLRVEELRFRVWGLRGVIKVEGSGFLGGEFEP